MRHRKSGKKLSRTWEHRKAMFRNMARSLLEHGKIRTTVTKAKELRKVADRLITLALRNDLHSRRLAFKVLASHGLVKKLFEEVGPCFAGVPGGFTRVVSLGLPRRGDSAPLAYIEFTRQQGQATEAAKPAAKKAEIVAAPVAVAPVAETPVVAAPEVAASGDVATEVATPEVAALEVAAPVEAAAEAPAETPGDAPAHEPDAQVQAADESPEAESKP